MRELTIGNKEIRVRATPLALLFYKQEFGTDLIGDMVKFSASAGDMTKIDTVSLLQLIWAMSKADNLGKQFPSFEKWLADLESIDFTDESFIIAAVEEAQDGFFRGSGGGSAK